MSETWVDVAGDHPFGLDTLPYGSFRAEGTRRVAVRIGDQALDLTSLWATLGRQEVLFAGGSLDTLLGAGAKVWAEVRALVTDWLSDTAYRSVVEPHLHAVDGLDLLMPFTVADYVDFYASEHHARNVGRIFRPGQPELPPNWKHLPIGYHGRAGTVVVSGTGIVRPQGQRLTADRVVEDAPSTRLDLEAELGFVVGTPSVLGTQVGLEEFDRHVFGVCVLNDWSARDIQSWETAPLGPFLGKSFATSISPWVVPLAALAAARVAPPPRDPPLVGYLDDARSEHWGLDVRLEVSINGDVITRPRAASMYWTPAQQLAHLTHNGASLRTGDLFASGTVSGSERHQRGSLLELSWNGQEPFTLTDGSSRCFLEDGDEVVISATAPGPSGRTIGLGAVSGRILPAR